ncbi:replication initiation protein [Pseudazoarcus pumilus]|uniref:Primase C-terminal 1 domain-containing protein n=1 Tax=Pseudazoarcus pumilus TaxID=2067960 RepID=A0A2I6S4I4_9RHOO|nr:replication initiation protein [Pseudazoarcus pumilus]AUN94159.1 hypothetical protein C0099_03900 [Pseudazoarcus pumilus]
MDTLSDLVLPRLPHRPYCTNNLQHGLVVRPASLASRMSHIQLNPPALRHWLLFDIDMPKAALTWERAHLPAPNWIATNPQNAHAHYGYLLETPVVTSVSGRDKPLRYAAAIEQALRLRLLADPGYCGLICKNPLHARWHTWHLHDHPYSLDELAEWVTLQKRRHTTDEGAGLGRNVTLFDQLRKWAYRAVLSYQNAGASPDLWLRAALNEAETLNQAFTPPLPFSEIRVIGRSVARWCWRNFSARKFSDIQRKRALRRWKADKTPYAERTRPWERLGISRRTYYNRKKASLLPTERGLH